MGWKEEFQKEKAKQQEKERLKQEKKDRERANMSETDKIAKEAWGTAKILLIGKYGLQMFIGVVILFFIGLFILDSIWNWFTGLF